MGVAALFYYHGHTTKETQMEMLVGKQIRLETPHDTVFVMEKIGIHIKLQQYF